MQMMGKTFTLTFSHLCIFSFAVHFFFIFGGIWNFLAYNAGFNYFSGLPMPLVVQ